VTKFKAVFLFSTKANKINEDYDKTRELKPNNVVNKERPDTAYI